MSDHEPGIYGVYRWMPDGDLDVVAVVLPKPSVADPTETVDEIFSEYVPEWLVTAGLRDHRTDASKYDVSLIGWYEAEALVDYFRRQSV
jgi:hypothetical protein